MFEEKTSPLMKAMTVFGAIFLVSLGLCGVNFWAVTSGGKVLTGIEPGFLVTTAYLELFGMIVGAVGLVIVAMIAMGKGILDQFSTKDSDSVSIIEKDEDK